MKLKRRFIWKQTIPLIISEINQCWTQTHQLTAAEWFSNYYSINHPLKHIMKQIGCFYLVWALDFTDWQQHVAQDTTKSKYGDVNDQTSFFLSFAFPSLSNSTSSVNKNLLERWQVLSGDLIGKLFPGSSHSRITWHLGFDHSLHPSSFLLADNCIKHSWWPIQAGWMEGMAQIHTLKLHSER